MNVTSTTHLPFRNSLLYRPVSEGLHPQPQMNVAVGDHNCVKSNKQRVWEWLVQRWGEVRALRMPVSLLPSASAYMTWAPISFPTSALESQNSDHRGTNLMHLMRAVKTGRICQVDQIFRHRFGSFWKPNWTQKGRVNKRDEFGGTPLMAACVMGVTDAARLLLQHGAQVNIADNDGYTPLWCAAFLGEAACLQLLLQFGADVNTEYGPSSPLHAAVISGNVQCVRLLLKAGAVVNSRHNKHRCRTPLHAASSSQLLQHVGYYGGIFLSPQKIQAAFDIIQILLSAGANVNAVDEDGNTPLHCLLQQMSSMVLMEGILLMVCHGANCSLRNSQGYTPRLLRKHCLSQRLWCYLQHLEDSWPLLPLQFLCFLTIRKSLGSRNLDFKVTSLHLPRRLQKGILQPLQMLAHDGNQ